jgi:O-antigen ligase
VVVVITLPLWPIFRLQRPLAIASVLFALMAVGAAAWWISTASEVMVATVGKDPGLTGRAALWVAVSDAIASRLWLGHGYNAFWLGWEGESATIWSSMQWKPPHAHNGILDLGLELGLLGIALFVIGFVVAAVRSVAVIGRTRTAYGVWPLAYLAFILMINLAESTILVRNTMSWMLYVVTCMWLARPHSDGKTGPA